MKKRYFLEEVVDYTFRKYKNFQDLNIIFPNRRAGLYFQKALSKKINKPIFSPKIQTLEEFIQDHTDIKIADDATDNIVLIHILFEIIQKYQDDGVKVSFEKFYYWGQILLNDFEDIDQSLEDESKIFKFIENQKEIEENFNFLDKENYESIKSFWSKFFPKMTINQKNFHKTWKILLKVYKDFKSELVSKRIGYKGFVYKDFLKQLKKGFIQKKGVNYLFVGFSILSNAEKKILKFFISEFSSMAFWDFDRYYFNDYKQEAGESFREFKEDKILHSTFPKFIPNNFSQVDKRIQTIGVGSQVGQAKILGAVLEKIQKKENFDSNKVLILLPNESLLFPVLNSVPKSINKINVTMGFPLSETPLYDLVQIILKVKKNVRIRDHQKSSYFKDILELISHPYTYQYDKDFSDKMIQNLNSKQFIYVPHIYFKGESELLHVIFNSSSDLLDNLLDIIRHFFNKIDLFGQLDKEYFIYFNNLFERLKKTNITFNSPEVLSKLLSQLSKLIKIPFSGEPLSGLQIMGVLESRNLDFDHVFVLSVNEGEFPKKIFNSSFIPFNIRKGFKLRTGDSIDKVYSYLFYRVIQRAKNITFIYNSKSDFGSSGEISRYVKQLELESKYTINHFSSFNDIEVSSDDSIRVEKSDEIINKLKLRFSEKSYMSPSVVKDYIDCSLKFYYNYVANIKEIRPFSEQIDKSEFGILSHNVLELLYKDILKNKDNKVISKNDFFKIKNSVEGAIISVTKKYFKLKSKSQFLVEGQNVILFEIIKDYVSKIISYDEKNAPFKVIDLEGDKKSGYKKQLQLSDNFAINISGFIDRIDEKDGIIRIIDYKTGGDSKKFRDIDSLFSDERKLRNNAVFQLFFYSILYVESRGSDKPIIPGLNNIREINNKDFDYKLVFGGKKIKDIREYLSSFEELLIDKINEIFDKKLSFEQTKDVEICKYCSYKNICNK